MNKQVRKAVEAEREAFRRMINDIVNEEGNISGAVFERILLSKLLKRVENEEEILKIANWQNDIFQKAIGANRGWDSLDEKYQKGVIAQAKALIDNGFKLKEEI